MATSEHLLTDYARSKGKPDPDFDQDDLTVDFDDDPEAYQEGADGSVTTYEDDDKPEVGEVPFDGNLAELMVDKMERMAIGQPLLELIEQDIEDRAPFDKKYAEGIKRSGLGEEGPGGAAFDGASIVTHPILTECTVDFMSAAMKEIMPPQGPVKTKIMGTMTPDKRMKSERKRDFMNWQLTDQIEEFPTEVESLLMQLPLAGSQYLHIFQDEDLGRPSAELVTSDNVILPYGASNFYMTPRLTIRMVYSESEVAQKIEKGKWIDIESMPPSSMPEKTRTQAASDRVEGVDESGFNEDGLKIFYRVFEWREFEWDPETNGKRAPYVMIIDSDTGDIANIRRNWDEGDPLMRKLDHVVEFKFFPWKGPYGIGFTHMIGGMSAAMTGALRALLDTAHINNFPALLKMKSKSGGQSISMEATGVTEIEGSSPVDDIRKIIMAVPYNPPSTVLFQLLGWLDQAAKGVVTTAEEKIADATNNGPVGTTLALIEQGSKVYANIHSRLHRSVKKCLKILHRLNRDHLEDKTTVEELGDLVVHQSDFEGPMDIIPVSDPHIFSESQRYAQLQAVRQLRTQEPDLFNRKALVRRELNQLRVDNPEELLVPDPQQIRANPVAENLMMAKGRPASAFPDQDHISHIKVLVAFMKDPNLGGSPLIAPKFIPRALEHMADHIIMWYGTSVYHAMGELVGPEFEQYMKMPQISGKIDQAIAMVVDELQSGMDSTLGGLNVPPVIQQAMQIMQQYNQPQDPNVMEVKRKERRDQMEHGLKEKKIGLEGKRTQLKHQVDMSRVQVSGKEIEQVGKDAETKSMTEIVKGHRSNQTAIAVAEINGKSKMDVERAKLDAKRIMDSEDDDPVQHYAEGGRVRHEDGLTISMAPVVAAIRDQIPTVDMSPVVDAIHEMSSKSRVDLSPVVTALRSYQLKNNQEMQSLREKMGDMKEAKTDITPLLDVMARNADMVQGAIGDLTDRLGGFSDEMANTLSNINEKHDLIIAATKPKPRKRKAVKAKVERDADGNMTINMKEDE